jgi:hypothetical protein
MTMTAAVHAELKYYLNRVLDVERAKNRVLVENHHALDDTDDMGNSFPNSIIPIRLKMLWKCRDSYSE